MIVDYEMIHMIPQRTVIWLKDTEQKQACGYCVGCIDALEVIRGLCVIIS